MSRRDVCTRFETAPAQRWRAGVLLLVAILPSAAPAAEPAGICALVAPAAGQDLETYFFDKPSTPVRSLIAEARRIAYEMWLLEALIDARFTIPGIDRNTIDGWSTPSSSMIELEAHESIGADPTYARRWAEANREILAQARRVATASPRFGRAGTVVGGGVYRVFQSAMGPVLWVDGVRAFAHTEPPPIGITVDHCNDTELCFIVYESGYGRSRKAGACLCFDPPRCRQAAREAWWSKSPWVLALDRCPEGKSCRDVAVRVDELLPPLMPSRESKGDTFDPPPGAETVRKGDSVLVVYGAEALPATDKRRNELEGKPIAANDWALQEYLQDKGAIVAGYPGNSKFLEWFNSQNDGAFNAGFFLGHNDEGAFKMTDGTSFTTEDAAQMRSGVMAKGATWTWAGCGTANPGTVNDFVSVSWFNQSGTTWGERGCGSFDVVDRRNSQRPTVGTGISFPEGGGWEGVAPLNGGPR